LHRLIVGVSCLYQEAAAKNCCNENDGKKRQPPFVVHCSAPR
jgi:hypothetical protein